MLEIPLQAIPNQSLTIVLDNKQYKLTIQETNSVMAITIIRDNITILDGERMLPDYPLIPYNYLEDGNFILTTANGEYPYYTRFGIDQTLIYASQGEIDAIRGT